LALVSIDGWQKNEIQFAKGLHPQSLESAVLNVAANVLPKKSNQTFTTLMLWKKSGKQFTETELVSSKIIEFVKSNK